MSGTTAPGSVEAVVTDVITLAGRMMENARESERAGRIYPGPYLGELEDLLDEHARAVEARLLGCMRDELARRITEREEAGP